MNPTTREREHEAAVARTRSVPTDARGEYIDAFAASLDRVQRPRRGRPRDYDSAAMAEASRGDDDGAAAAGSDYLRHVCHELRQPLVVAVGYVSMLEDGSFGELPPEAAAVLRTDRRPAGRHERHHRRHGRQRRQPAARLARRAQAWTAASSRSTTSASASMNRGSALGIAMR